MAKFFEKLMERFFDFFNMGRLLTIFIPGVVAACCAVMLMSQLIFPATDNKKESEKQQAVVEAPAKKASEGASATVKKPTAEPKAVAQPGNKKSDSLKSRQETEAGVIVTKTPQFPKDAERAARTALADQVRSDFQRMSNHNWLVVLVAVVLGFPIYEIGYRLLSNMSDDEKLKPHALYPYDDAGDPTDKKDLFKLGGAAPDKNKAVGIMYFAPFLKEKFSGEENYFNFLITEFYRFQEFSTVMPVSVVISVTVGYLYYVLFSLRQHYWLSSGIFSLLFVSLVASAYLYYRYVTVPGMESYARSRQALVQGVSAMMSKGVVKT